MNASPDAPDACFSCAKLYREVCSLEHLNVYRGPVRSLSRWVSPAGLEHQIYVDPLSRDSNAKALKCPPFSASRMD
ncbi:unnamed protein product [Dicrocoelium dendriticum]|nr:unnamed protein product [Dicrocoelium dendriticum]